MTQYKQIKKKPGEDPREFDQSSCTQSTHGYKVHRDYAAHFFRWGFCHRFVKAGMKVLDVGCGKDQPLPRVLTDRLANVPKLYVGVDFDDIEARWHFSWLKIIGSFDFTRRWKELLKAHGRFDLIVNFEVIEHMHKDAGQRLLRGARELLTPRGTFMLSTPCYDGRRMALHHIHEYWRHELVKEIERAGLTVIHVFGTFMDIKELKKIRPEHQVVARALRCYYSDEVLSCFLAPLYPELARNNIWILKKGA